MSIHDPRNLRRGPWVDEEDDRLTITVEALGEKHWDALAKQSGIYISYNIRLIKVLF